MSAALDASDEYLDEVILTHTRSLRRKVALVFVFVRQQCDADNRLVDDDKLDERLRYLVDSGQVEAFGNILNWRFSEVCLKRDDEAVNWPR